MAERWLSEGERVLVSTRPHARVVALPLALAPLVVVAASYSWFAFPSTGWERWLRVAVEVGLGLLLLRRCVVPVLRRATTRYVVTTERVVVASGVLVRREQDVALDRVADAWTRRGPLDRLLGSGTLVVESAGERGSLVLERVPGIGRVQRALHEGRRGAARPGWQDSDERSRA